MRAGQFLSLLQQQIKMEQMLIKNHNKYILPIYICNKIGINYDISITVLPICNNRKINYDIYHGFANMQQ